MSDQFIGELRAFAFDFVPRGWARCDGQLLPINQNTPLFALIGTAYGGDGRITFAVPDLRGRAAIGAGHGQGLSDRLTGQAVGDETVRLTAAQLPAHRHAVGASSTAGTASPSGSFPAPAAGGPSFGTSADVPMNPRMIAPAGGGRPHENMPPSLVVTWCIAVEGVFPARP